MIYKKYKKDNWILTFGNGLGGNWTLENIKTGVIDFPIMYPHNSQIAYEWPERIPQRIKNFCYKYVRPGEEVRKELSK